MKLKYILMAVLVMTLFGISTFWVISRQPKTGPATPAKVASLAPDEKPAVTAEAATPAAPEIVLPEKKIATELVKSNPSPEVQLTKSGKPKHEKPPIQDPDARAALSLVGADPKAEQYWVAAINDPNLPAEERKDLIEDLNEDGLSDPKHPGPQDVALIVSRIQLIEELAPNSMDPVNARAFAEAYKDLNNMLDGEPVK
jgi:hypothetical protein